VESGEEEGSGASLKGHEDFAGFRERQPVDSFRHVAWKAAARNGVDKPLLVKLFRGGAGKQLWLDWRETEGNPEERLSILTGWVMTAETAGLNYGLRLPDREIPLGHGPAHRHHCLRVLALYPEKTG
jgi:uncharacterized protein (DUF58 family)